jgi:hypothetical protein
VLEGLSRVLRELLRTPRFRANVRILLREFDPENAGLLVRACREEDPELFLSVLASAPAATNAAVEATRELLIQLLSFPPPLIASFLSETVRDLDGKRLGETVGLLATLLARAAAAGDEALGAGARQFAQDFAAGVRQSVEKDEQAIFALRDAAFAALARGTQDLAVKLGAQAEQEGSATQRAVAALADGIRAAARENPAFVRSVVAPLLAAGRDALAIAEDGAKHD